jgi:hypothetical protein
MQFETSKFETVFFRSIMGLCIFAVLGVMGVYVYLGTFSRYLSDDYCEAVKVHHTNPAVACRQSLFQFNVRWLWGMAG